MRQVTGKMRCVVVGMSIAAAMAVYGCGPQPAAPPVSLVDYQLLRRADPQVYPAQTLVMYNLQRALDPELAPEDRLNSMRLVAYLDRDDPSISEQFSDVLTDLGYPRYLIQSARPRPADEPGGQFTAQVAQMLDRLRRQAGLQQ